MRNLITIVLLFMTSIVVAQEDYRAEYQHILSQECSFKKSGSTDERDLSWGCTKEKTEQLLVFRNKLEERLKSVMSSDSTKLSAYNKYKDAWENYYASTKEFDFEFHSPGSGGTGLRLKSEQNAAKQRVEILISYLMDFYAL